MAMGRRKQRQEALFITATELPKSAGHPFYQKLNQLLAEANFDKWIERRCQQYYAPEEKRGQPSIPPGLYFRMLLVGYLRTWTASAASLGGAPTAYRCETSCLFP